ncbi:hypothetical protein QCA50_004948 [Cerrena zonata]|uniref:N-acetyltransferase domain-containing protein n=1 Tax=Cerrena zonata TaxID=2478898 RepID=A0AAW0GK79_9APHY
MSVTYDLVSQSDIDAAHTIEVASYPSDEAATLQAFQYRQQNAPELFLGAYLGAEDSRTLVGYVCSTLSPDPTLTHHSMETHVSGAPSVCIHSVCVSQAHRRKGIAVGLLKEYISHLERARERGSPYERILLIAHEELQQLYAKAGFELVGPSSVVHGSRPWFEMRKVLTQSAPPSIPPGLMEALSATSRSKRPIGKLLGAFPSGLADVSDITPDSPYAVNLFDLLCPREGCGSIILKNGVATLVEHQSIQLEPPSQTNPFLEPLPTPPASAQWWKVTPSAMTFENIGFSRAVEGQVSPAGKTLKLLLCAECDLGPLGWCEQGGTEFWLASNRVSYHQ